MLVRAFLPDTYLTLWTEHAAAAIRNTFGLTQGKVGYFAAPPQDGHTLWHFEFVPSDYGGGPPYTTVYYWAP